jgi:hypothetical protein
MKYLSKRPVDYYIRKNKIDQLSPAEKYSLLVGDPHELSDYMWQRGLDEIAKFGYVRNWSGLCHGLALASASLPRPKYAVKIKSFDGKHLIKFFPEDIKALGVYLWGGDYIPSRIIGGRCEKEHLGRNSRDKLPPECLDTNPGTFHLAVINRIGVQGKVLIMDNASDKSVWNFPIVKYKFKYKNPKTKKSMDKITDAMVPIDQLARDKFKKYRSSDTRYIVEVDAQVDYLTIRSPQARDRDSTTSPPIVTHHYFYDLEINALGEIIGGEWYNRNHPDFIWIPQKGIDPKAPYDPLITGSWEPKTQFLPQNWAEMAVLSAKTGQLSSPIVKALFELSNMGVEGTLPKL